MFRTLPSRGELARLDSFALGEAVAARLRVMSGTDLRAFAEATELRSEGYYRAELARALQENPTNDAVLLDSLVAFFRANPRAIDRCDPAFLNGVMQSLDPHDVEVAIDDDNERQSGSNPVLLGAGVALLLVGAGAAIDRGVTMLHAGSYATPAAIVVYVTPQPKSATAQRVRVGHAFAQPKHVAHPAPQSLHARLAPRHTHHAVFHAKPVRVAKHSPHSPAPRPKQKPPQRVATGPEWRTPPARAESLAVRSATPRPRSWLQRQLDHLNPFKKRAADNTRTPGPASPPQP